MGTAGRARGRGTYGSAAAGILVAVAVAGGGLAHEVLVGPVAPQAAVAAGAAVGDGLGGEQTGGLGAGLGPGAQLACRSVLPEPCAHTR